MYVLDNIKRIFWIFEELKKIVKSYDMFDMTRKRKLSEGGL